MNKRIRKKKDITRMNGMIAKSDLIDLIDNYILVYTRLIGYKNCRDNDDFWKGYDDDDFWKGYDKWNASYCSHKTWSYMSKKHNIPKHFRHNTYRK